MNFENPLISGVLIKRYKRFFVDIKIKNKIITAHCPNTGSMMGLLKKGNKVWITKSDNKKRKLKYTLQIIEDGESKVGVNTHLTNGIILEGLRNNIFKDFSNESIIKPEQKFGLNTRFDFLINDKGMESFIEVKNVTLSRTKNLAEFPDSPTSRGLKHIEELIKASNQGYGAYLLFVIQREDCKKFQIAQDIDPKYSELLTAAIKKKIKIICYDCKFLPKGIKLNNKISLIN